MEAPVVGVAGIVLTAPSQVIRADEADSGPSEGQGGRPLGQCQESSPGTGDLGPHGQGRVRGPVVPRVP